MVFCYLFSICYYGSKYVWLGSPKSITQRFDFNLRGSIDFVDRAVPTKSQSKNPVNIERDVNYNIACVSSQ